MSTTTEHLAPDTKRRPRPRRPGKPGPNVWKPLGGILQVRDGPGGPVWILDQGITVYPARARATGWRAQWYDPDGTRRAVRATNGAALADKLAPVVARLRLDATNTERTGAELVAWFLSPNRLPVERAWSRSHRAAQERLCRMYILPDIGTRICDDIRVADLQAGINRAATPGQGRRAAKCVHALAIAGLDAGYLTNPRLASPLHWQALGRPYDTAKRPNTGLAGIPQVLSTEIPGHQQIADLAASMAEPTRAPWWRELMPYIAAYSGLRLGELLALPATSIDCEHRQIRIDVKTVSIDGETFLEEPKGRRHRTTIYPQRTPLGRPLAELIQRRIAEVLHEHDHGLNPHGLMFPAPRGGYLSSSNFSTRIAKPAYRLSGWRDADGRGPWTWHSLRHTFCSTALTAWNLPIADVSILVGHANARITMELYVGALAGMLQRAFDATANTPSVPNTAAVK